MPTSRVPEKPALSQALEVLTGQALATTVDVVAWVTANEGEHDSVRVANHRGRAVLRPGGRIDVLVGESPIPATDPMAFLPYRHEVEHPSPENASNSYPYARERLLSVLRAVDRSPDLVVVPVPSLFLGDRGGHVGEHGSLDVIQSRAPLIISGPTVAASGLVHDHARLLDVTPTLLHLLGVDAEHRVDAAGSALDGHARSDLAGPSAGPILGLLWDGAHCGELLAMAERGELPGVARLLSRGCALTGGAVAEFPSVTLTNHTSILTGLSPARHGVLGNVFLDRASGRVIDANTSASWHTTERLLRPDVRTVFQMVAAARPDSQTACVNEPIDAGSSYSTMALVRAAGDPQGADGLTAALPSPRDSHYLGNPQHLRDEYYAWCTQVDDVGLEQTMQVLDSAEQAPTLTWWSAYVTDAGHHAGGPRSEIARDAFRDADRRLQALLDHLAHRGILDDTTILLTADHGFEGTDPQRDGDWLPSLLESGLDVRDLGPGFVYLD